MNIILATGIYPPESGGPATYTYELAAVWRVQGHHVTVIAYGDDQPTDKGVIRVSRHGGALLRYVRYAWKTYVVARHADVLYVQGAVSEGIPATIAAWCSRRPIVMRVPGDYAWEMAQQHGETDLLDEFLTKQHRGIIGIYERLERWTSRCAKRLIVPSEYLKKVVQGWGVSSERIVVIQSTVPPLPMVGSSDEFRRRFGLDGRRIVLTVVRAVPWKGVDFLLDVLTRLPKEIVLVCAGEGPMLQAWQQMAGEEGLTDRVRLLGRIPRDELAPWYAASDVFVLATGYEGYPHVVVEAVSAGLPCLVSDRGGNPETKTLFPEYVTVLPYRDLEAWTTALSSEHPRLPPARLRPFAEAADEALSVLRSVISN